MANTFRGELSRVTLLDLCRELRHASTNTETLLWKLLRNRQTGFKFRRQHQYGPFILDFYCPERKLVIEADGDQHFFPEKKEQEKERTDYLLAHGLRILRFSNYEILTSTETVIEVIWNALHEEPSP